MISSHIHVDFVSRLCQSSFAYILRAPPQPNHSREILGVLFVRNEQDHNFAILLLPNSMLSIWQKKPKNQRNKKTNKNKLGLTLELEIKKHLAA